LWAVTRPHLRERAIMPPWKPEIRVIGTYKVHVDVELLRKVKALDRLTRKWNRASYPIGYEPGEPERAWKYEEMMSAILIELTMSDTDSRFLHYEFGQPGSEQAPYMLKYLTEDGMAVVSDEEFGPPPEGKIRLAFFLHCFDSSQPLKTSYGQVAVPSPVEMPERLRRIFRYEPVT
jgi:hypothetical protein